MTKLELRTQSTGYRTLHIKLTEEERDALENGRTLPTEFDTPTALDLDAICIEALDEEPTSRIVTNRTGSGEAGQ